MTTAPKTTDRPAERKAEERPGGFVGEMWAMVSVLGYSTSNLLGRAGVVRGDPLAGPLLRDLPSFVMGLVMLVRSGAHRELNPRREEFRGRSLLLFVASGVVSLFGTFAFFYGLNVGGVNIVVPVLQTQIIWGALIAWWLLGEKLELRRGLGVLLALAGLVVLAFGQSQGVPVSDRWLLGALLALVPALGWGASGVIWRLGQQRHGVSRATGITVHYGTSALLGLLYVTLSGNLGVFGTLTSQEFSALLLSGVFGGMIGVYAMFTAMKLLPAATVYVLNGFTPILVAIGGWLFLNEYVNAVMWAGILITSLGVVVFQLSAQARGRAAGKART